MTQGNFSLPGPHGQPTAWPAAGFGPADADHLAALGQKLPAVLELKSSDRGGADAWVPEG